MAHIFRLYTAGGSDNIDGWADSIEYGTKAIGSISDPGNNLYSQSFCPYGLDEECF